MDSPIAYRPYPKTSRLFSPVVVTEKVDGTNGCIMITDSPSSLCASFPWNDSPSWVEIPGRGMEDGKVWVSAGSKSRLLDPSSKGDNFGFCKWVHANAYLLFQDLGVGVHHGEWAGKGIQRGYGLENKKFFLFNTRRFKDAEFMTPDLHTVPVLYEGEYYGTLPYDMEQELSLTGSRVNCLSSTSIRSEGICIFWSHDNTIKKVVWNK